ncbi:MAG: helix-turn-helix domain-containing protein [Alphaproteobacteria bacterium]
MATNPNPVDIHVGKRLRQRRTFLGMTQEQLGNALGITFQQVQKYERGTNRVGASRLYDISQVLDVTPQFFFDEMEGDKSSGFAERGQAPFAADGVMDREIMDLVRAFRQISNPTIRQRTTDLIRALSRQD